MNKAVVSELKKRLVDKGIELIPFSYNNVQTLFELFAESFWTYEIDELSYLKHFRLPNAICETWQRIYHPDGVYLGSDIHLFSLEHMIEENTQLAPGALIIKYGYLAFAGTSGGDVLCLNLNSDTDDPEVYFASHSIFCDKNIAIFQDGELRFFELSQSVVNSHVIRISESLTGLFELLLHGEIGDIEDFVKQ